jgi:hypothetical protein
MCLLNLPACAQEYALILDPACVLVAAPVLSTWVIRAARTAPGQTIRTPRPRRGKALYGNTAKKATRHGSKTACQVPAQTPSLSAAFFPAAEIRSSSRAEHTGARVWQAYRLLPQGA